MKTSPSIATISAAIRRAQANIGAASKDAKNPFFSSSYADLGSVMAVCKEPLLSEGISVLQPIDTRDDGSIVLETILLHESGEYIGSSMKITPQQRMVCPKSDKEKFTPYLAPDPQAEGSAITYARRYALQALVFIPSVDDDAEWAARALQNRPLPAETATQLKEKVSELIEAVSDAKTDEERLAIHRDAMKLEKGIQNRSPEAIAIAAYEEEHPEHKNKVSNARLVDGAWEFDIIGSTTKATTGKAKAAKKLPPAAIPWQEVICHIGATVKGKALGAIFTPERTPEAMASIVKFFSDSDKMTMTDEDREKLPALKEAAREGYAAWKKANSAPQPTAPAEAPQRPATPQAWHDFVIESKDATMHGKKMRELTPAQMEAIGGYMAKIDMASATIYQKKLKAMYALATGGAVSPELPAHVKDLDVKLRESKIEPEVFLREMKNTGLIAESYTSMAEITEPEAREMLGNWTAVVEACDVIDVESTTSK